MLDQKLKILYVHGLDSAPRQDKSDILRRLGAEVHALHIDYRENPDAYWILYSYIVKEGINFLVGSSYGGMLSYYLAGDLNIPALLFNPALHSVSLEPELPKQLKHPQANIFVVLGANDKTIPPQKSLKFFKAHQIKNTRIITCEWLAHQIDLITFQEMCQWAVSAYQNTLK